MKHVVWARTAAAAALFALLIAISSPASASRYAKAEADVLTAEQQRPLLVTVTIDFPKAYITTVGDAVKFALARSGYSVAPPESVPDQAALFFLPLPDVHRHFENTQLVTVLEALGQPGYRLSVDDLHRFVGYRVIDRYNSYAPRPNATPSSEGATQ